MKRTVTIFSFVALCVVVPSFGQVAKQQTVSGTTGQEISGPADKVDPTPLLTNGMTEEEVYLLAGKPKGIMIFDSRTVLLYSGAQIDIENGVVVGLPENFSDTHGKTGFRFGSILDSFKKITVEPVAALLRKSDEERAQKAAEKAFFLMDKDGEPVDHAGLVQTGKVTVVIFYTDWCTSYKQMEPDLSALMKETPDAALKMVNIDNGASTISKQYAVTFIPNVRVFDRYGNLVAKPTSDLKLVKKHLYTAIKR